MRFKTKLRQKDDGFMVELPFDAKEELGKARAPVKVTINGFTFRTTVAVYGGKYFIGIRRSNREAAGIEAGDSITMHVELDEEERTVTAPKDLAKALAKSARAKKKWDALSYTHKREHVEAIESAKKPETRARRIARAIEMLLEKK